jgi:membrane fusion protein (multidrug efflux system)
VKKRLFIAVVLLAVVCGGLISFNEFRKQAIGEFFATMQRPPVVVSATEVEAVDWQPVIEAFGTVGAIQGVDLAAETAGIVGEILFSANERVEKGQLLVQLEDEVEQADLIAARATVERDRQALERAETLSQRGVSSEAALQTAESALAAARSQLQRLQAVLDRKRVEAPFDGIIGIPRIEAGQYLTAGQTIATLQNLDLMRVDFTVREQAIGQLDIGQPVRAGLAEGALGFDGQITGIDPKIDPNSRLVSVRAEIANPGTEELRPGQFARVEVILPEETGVLAVPQTAVVSSLYGDYVYVVAPPEDAEPPAEVPDDVEDGEEQPVAGRTGGTPGESDGAGAAATAPPAGAPEAGRKGDDRAAAQGEAASAGAPSGAAYAAEPEPAGEHPAEAEAGAEPDAAPEDEPLVARQAFVQTGRHSGGFVEIVEGLGAGQVVVTAGQNKLTSGARVTIDNTVDPGRLATARRSGS